MSIALQEIQQRVKAKPSNGKTKQPSAMDFLNKDISLFGSGLSDKNKERFYSELNILFSAGVDIKSALELIEEDQTKKSDKILFGKIKEFILKGGSLSEALQKSGKFSAYEYYSIRIGEESGRLPEVLNDLSKYFSKQIAQRRQFMNALSYPVIVLCTAVGAIWFMLSFIVPMFSDVFKRFGGDLPAITKFVLNLSEFVSVFFPYLFVAIITAAIFIISQRKQDWFRKISASVIIKIPIIGEIIKKIYLARFCNSMNLLIGASTPLVEAISLVEKMVGFYPLEKSLSVIKEKILRGMPLHKALAEFSIYNRRMISLLKVAEEVNQLDVIFGKLAKQYDDEVEHQAGLLSSTLEPILIIFIGIFVAAILVAMYLPLFELSTTIG